jgi:3-oxoacyl-[acyl-carrier-protein] synthase II
MTQPIAITGVGVLCAAGRGLSALGDTLADNRFCGSQQQSALPVSFGGVVDAALPPHPDHPDDRKADLAFGALADALADAGLEPGDWPEPSRRAVFLGTGLSSVTPGELEEDLYPHLRDGHFDRAAMARDLSPDRAAPRRHMPARVTASIAHQIGARGPTGTNFSACAAASQAMLEATRAIRRGEAELAVVGGHDSMLHPLGMLSFIVLGALSPTRCRPFDRSRDGFMMGEGAAMFVLESLDHARARGARIQALLLGGGTSVDAWNATAPHPEGVGAELAMRRALRDSGLSHDAVDYVNFHGTGTPLGDVAEATAVARVFGPDVACSSIKGAVGHTIAAAGAVEAAACIAALQRGMLPGTVGLDELDPSLPLAPLASPRAGEPRTMLSNSFGFGGQNCALLLGHPDLTPPAT